MRHVGFIVLFFSLSLSLSWALFTGRVHMHYSHIVEKFNFRFLLPLFNPKSNLFSFLRNPSFQTINPQILLNLDPPKAHVDKFSNLSSVNFVTEPKSYHKFFAKIFYQLLDEISHSRWWSLMQNYFQSLRVLSKFCGNQEKFKTIEWNGVFHRSNIKKFVYYVTNFE